MSSGWKRPPRITVAQVFSHFCVFKNPASFKAANKLCFYRKRKETKKAADRIISYKYKHKNILENLAHTQYVNVWEKGKENS